LPALTNHRFTTFQVEYVTRRYYLPEIPTAKTIATLPPAESQHAIKVMRIQVGDSIELFDGVGNQASAMVSSVTRKDCHCTVEAAEPVDREPSCNLTLAIALPKPDRCREMVERLTELGVRRIAPIVAKRTQRGPSPSVIDKLRRAVIEACKQSGRNVLMDIADPGSLDDFVRQTNETDIKWIAHPDGEPMTSQIANDRSSAIALIGPEGGWTEDEVALSIDAGYEKIGLGKRIYRIETAATYIASRLIDG